MKQVDLHRLNNGHTKNLSFLDLADSQMPFSGPLKVFIEKKLQEDSLFVLDNLSLQEFWNNCSVRFSRYAIYELGIFPEEELRELQNRLLFEVATVSTSVASLFIQRVRRILGREEKS